MSVKDKIYIAVAVISITILMFIAYKIIPDYRITQKVIGGKILTTGQRPFNPYSYLREADFTLSNIDSVICVEYEAAKYYMETLKNKSCERN